MSSFAYHSIWIINLYFKVIQVLFLFCLGNYVRGTHTTSKLCFIHPTHLAIPPTNWWPRPRKVTIKNTYGKHRNRPLIFTTSYPVSSLDTAVLDARSHVVVRSCRSLIRHNRIRSDAARLNHIMKSLTHEVMAEVKDYIMAPLGTFPYDTFRAELIRRTFDSRQKRLRQLLVDEKLEHRRPSQLLRRMK